MKKTTRAFVSLLIYCILLTGIYFASKWLQTAPSTIKLLMNYISYGFYAMGLFFGWWFNRSRVFFCTLTLMLGQLFLLSIIPYGMDKELYHSSILSMVAVYFPLNFLVFSSTRERGIISAWGRMRLLYVFIEFLISAWIIWYNDTDLLQLFNIKLFPSGLKFLPELPHISTVLFITAFIYLFARQSTTNKSQDAPFVGITIFTFVALLCSRDLNAASLMFALSGLLLVAVVIRASYSMAYLDELTGLPSRRALKEEMLKLAGKYSIAMLDIDYFKKFNDTHGHDVGDDVLKLVAASIKGVGGGGKAFRYGGEEFTVLFPGSSVEEAFPYLEELREHIAGRGFVKRSKSRPKDKPLEIKTKNGGYRKLHLTVSIGVAEKSEKYKTAEEVITAADSALYRAKEKGRNCVCK